MRRIHLSTALVIGVMTLAPLAGAADAFEIQVYQGEHNDPGQASVELHTNYTFAGTSAPSYPGELPADRALRMTLEPAIGVTEWLELGAYLQGIRANDGQVRFAGWKLRAKTVVPERFSLPVTLGLNVEVGRVPHAIEENGWANELRPIVGVRVGRFGATVNPIIGYALTGPDAFEPELEPAAKVKLITDLGFSVGAEYYADLGHIGAGFEPLSAQEHLVFAVFDLEPPPDSSAESSWELNAGIGHGLTAGTASQWIAKVIVGREF